MQIQYVIIIISFMIPLFALCYYYGFFWLIPQVGYGEIVSSTVDGLAPVNPALVNFGVQWKSGNIGFRKFFDFRAVYGDRGLLRRLREHLEGTLRAKAPFFKTFAENALLSRPPIGMFGKLVVGSQGNKPKALNLKSAMMLVVTFARLYALRNNLLKVNTIDRLHKLYELDVLNKATRDETVVAYDFLMRLRLAHQTLAIARNEEPDNFIQPKALTAIESTTLKQIFTQFAGLQKKISLDFLGVA